MCRKVLVGFGCVEDKVWLRGVENVRSSALLPNEQGAFLTPKFSS
jgi:hypothetical protein